MSIENTQLANIHVGQEYKELATDLASQLPQLRTLEDLEMLEARGYDMHSEYGSHSLNRLSAQRSYLGFANRTLVRVAQQQMEICDEDTLAGMPETEGRLEEACIKASRLVLDLVLRPPDGIEVCSRNPKLEFPSLAKILLQADLNDVPVPFMVPCCPDTNQYKLGDGLGDIIPKALDYCDILHDLFDGHGFGSMFDVQVADIEGHDPIILASTGETTESHFAKTRETIRKAQAEVVGSGKNSFASVRSMESAFTEAGMSYSAEQLVAIKRITNSEGRKVHKTVEGLLKERVRLGNFDRFDEQDRRGLVVAELAGYAAYGAMVGGRAIIMSPDAKSAIPAYHYALDNADEYSPVLYAA